MNVFTKSSCMAVLVSNDIHYIHFMAKGEDFDKIHLLAEEYYKQLEEETDFLYELAIEYEQPIVNYSSALKQIKDYDIEEEDQYDYEDAVHLIMFKLELYVDCLIELQKKVQEEDVKSKLDDIIRKWNKEINYKLKRRMK